jgi:predicted nucleotidyltransferase
MTTLDDVVRQLAELLEERGIPYAVMGGLAVRVHGIPRPTHDVDLTIKIKREELEELYAAVEELGYSVPETYRGGWIDQVAGMPLVKFRLHVMGHAIDIDIFLAESQFQLKLLSRRQQLTIEEKSLWIVSPEDLILLKLLASRTRDFADIGDILFTQGTLDEAYLRKWAALLGVEQKLEEVLANPPD